MINKVSRNDYLEHISNSRRVKNVAQWSDQYELNIKMIKPSKKEKIPFEMIEGFTLNGKNLTIESSKVGTKDINYFSDSSIETIDVEIQNNIDISSQSIIKEDTTYDYLFYNKGKKIIPSDGTFLLVTDFYFYLECYALDAKWNKKLLDRGYFILDGEVSLGFSTRDSSIQVLQTTFKKIVI